MKAFPHLRSSLAPVVAVAASLATTVRGDLPALSISSDGNRVTLHWGESGDAGILESAPVLFPSAEWSAIEQGVSKDGNLWTYEALLSSGPRFFRLKAAGSGGDLPIVAPSKTWTWVAFQEAACLDGSETGIGVNLNPSSNRVLVFLQGGGACWDEATCYTLNTAVRGPYGAAQFGASVLPLSRAWMFDRSSASNPFRDYNFVFVPYCTGDLHAGSRTLSHGDHPTSHVGFRNMAAYLKRLVPTFSKAERVVLAGSSVGGLGAVFNWDQTQRAFGNVRVDLVDDSGPVLPLDPETAGTTFLGPVARANWNFPAAMPAGCAECAEHPELLLSHHLATHPAGRAAFLGYLWDATMQNYYGISTQQYADTLDAWLASQFDATSRMRYFVVAGTSHVLLPGGSSIAVGDATLAQFLEAMLSDDPEWSSVLP